MMDLGILLDGDHLGQSGWFWGAESMNSCTPDKFLKTRSTFVCYEVSTFQRFLVAKIWG